MESLYKVRKEDFAALKKMGLEPPAITRLPHGGMTPVGEIGGETWSAKVSVCAMPARFWEFEILPEEGEPVTLKTGSGRVEDFLPAVVLFGLGMIIV